MPYRKKTAFLYIVKHRLTFSSLWHKGRCDYVDVGAVHHNLICGLCDLLIKKQRHFSINIGFYLFFPPQKAHAGDKKLLSPNTWVREKSMIISANNSVQERTDGLVKLLKQQRIGFSLGVVRSHGWCRGVKKRNYSFYLYTVNNWPNIRAFIALCGSELEGQDLYTHCKGHQANTLNSNSVGMPVLSTAV